MNNWINRCHFGDVRDVLRQMAAAGVKVNCIVTSPPYWGLRSYLPEGHPDKAREIGSEPTLGEFIATLTDVFQLAREVLADDGTCFVNMGDAYAGSWGAQGRQGEGGQVAGRSACAERQIAAAQRRKSNTGSLDRAEGLKNKDLMGQPWRLAFALQDAGWYLRQDIIWSKPNPMPESVQDRCTKAHEYLFLLSKSERYWWDFAAMQEPASPDTNARYARGRSDSHKWADGGPGGQTIARSFAHTLQKSDGTDAAPADMPSTRNRRSVWTIPTAPYSGAHFATFPPALIEPCILAGCPAGGIVLDPFMGSGTTGQVAQRLGMNWIGIDLDQRNEALQRDRIGGQAALILEQAA